MQNENKLIKGVLFDLDGTLLDTAPDMVDALNDQRQQHQLNALPLDLIRPHVGQGSRSILKVGFNIEIDHPNYEKMVNDYFDCYEKRIAEKTVLFPHVESVLNLLNQAKIPWGIVTNKPKRFALPLFDHFQLNKTAACLVCGDTLPKRKPDPDPILHAASIMQIPIENLVYVGDTNIDVLASKRANMKSLIALYGYIQQDVDPYTWEADGYLATLLDIIPWLGLKTET